MGLLNRHADRSARLSGGGSARAHLRRARRRADQHQILAGRAPRRAGGPRPPPAGQGLLQERRTGRQRRRRGLSARTDHPRRERQLRHGLCRYQRTHQVPRPEPVGSGQSRVHGLQQAALCHRGTQEPRHHRAQATREQETGRAVGRRNLRAMAAVRQAQQYRRVEGHDREHRDSGASTHARSRADRRSAWLFVPALCRSQGPRRAARRHRPDADGGLRDEALRQRYHRQFKIRRGEAGGGQGVPACLPERSQGNDQAPGGRRGVNRQTRRRGEERSRARARAHGDQGQHRHARGESRRVRRRRGVTAGTIDRPDRIGPHLQSQTQAGRDLRRVVPAAARPSAK